MNEIIAEIAYIDGYRDCNKDWKRTINKKIDELQKQYNQNSYIFTPANVVNLLKELLDDEN